MRFGILTRNRNSWSSVQLQKALSRRSISCTCFSFPKLIARLGYKPNLTTEDLTLPEQLDALVIRPVGRGSIEELVFRMDVLYRLERLGMYVINPAEAIEHCVDKYDVLAMLEESGIPVPRTVVTEDDDQALRAFKELNSDVIIKPLFGSRGMGSTRVTDEEIASTLFKAVRYYHGVIYLQEFVHHGSSDIRALVVGNKVLASMRRVADSWKTNYSQGARPEAITLTRELEDMAIKSARLVQCRIAGVDILESEKGPAVIDVNSQPGWKGLQSVTRTNIANEMINFIVSELK